MEPSQNYSDKATFGIKDDIARYTWTTYCIFIFLTSLIGDITILVAAIKYKAFKLNKFIVVIIPHPENLKFPPRRFFLFSVARSLRSQISAILNTANSVATGHKKLIPNQQAKNFEDLSTQTILEAIW